MFRRVSVYYKCKHAQTENEQRHTLYKSLPGAHTLNSFNLWVIFGFKRVHTQTFSSKLSRCTVEVKKTFPKTFTVQPLKRHSNGETAERKWRNAVRRSAIHCLAVRPFSARATPTFSSTRPYAFLEQRNTLLHSLRHSKGLRHRMLTKRAVNFGASVRPCCSRCECLVRIASNANGQRMNSRKAFHRKRITVQR